MAQVKRIKYDQVIQVISERKIKEKMDDIEKKIKGTPIYDEKIHKIYTDASGNINYEYTCPCCGSEAVFSDYSCSGSFKSVCCKNKMYFARNKWKVILLYGFKAVIDNRECEIFLAPNINNCILCFDFTNFRKYMWDDGEACNRTFYGYYGTYIYLDGDDFMAIHINENTPIKMDRYRHPFDYAEELIGIKRKASTVYKKPRTPVEFENIKKGA